MAARAITTDRAVVVADAGRLRDHVHQQLLEGEGDDERCPLGQRREPQQVAVAMHEQPQQPEGCDEQERQRLPLAPGDQTVPQPTGTDATGPKSTWVGRPHRCSRASAAEVSASAPVSTSRNLGGTNVWSHDRNLASDAPKPGGRVLAEA